MNLSRAQKMIPKSRATALLLLTALAFPQMGCTTTAAVGSEEQKQRAGTPSKGLQVDLAESYEDSRSVYRASRYRIIDIPNSGNFYLPATLVRDLSGKWIRAKKKLKRNPHDTWSLRVLAIYELSLGNPLAASTYIGIARSKRGGFDAASSLVLALAHLASGHSAKARAEFSRAESTTAGFVLSRMNRGLNALHRGNSSLAATHFRSILSRQPDHVLAHLHLGQSYYLKRNFQLSLKHFERAAEIDPENDLAHFNRGVVLHRGFQRFDDARDALQKVAGSEKASMELKNRAEGALVDLDRADHGQNNLATIGVY